MSLRKIGKYTLLEKWYQGTGISVHLASKEGEHRRFALKVLDGEAATLPRIQRLRREFQVAKDLPISGIIRPVEMLEEGSAVALVLEDIDGHSLREHLKEHRLPLAEFLRTAISIAQTLGELHRHNVIHKDIKPANIIVSRSTGEVKITDFGISSVVLDSAQDAGFVHRPAGTLAYISPEQTGRVQRRVDWRSDLYSLGVTYYEMLTGRLPFSGEDAIGLIHAHIARIPTAPSDVDPSVPKVISGIVMRLMAKTPEDRYQNAHGVAKDLEECKRMILDGGIKEFPLGRWDITDKFHIPQKLYGRGREVELLLAAFHGAAEGNARLLTVSGYSGIGKSALVHELQKPILRRNGNFISGKFDQYKRNIPYLPLINAFQELVRKLLTESAEGLSRWRERINAALGANGQVIAAVIPEIEAIIGKQPPVAELPAAESQNRFNFVFQEFVKAVATKEHPLALFLDDLQWADIPSLKLIETMMTGMDIRHLLLLGAYRDNEVDHAHPLMTTLREVEKGDAEFDVLFLSPLPVLAMRDMIGDAFRCEKALAEPLAEICHLKTGGNPFFFTQFLRKLYEDGLLRFDQSAARWRWDTQAIDRCGITDNVVELMAGKIRALSGVGQEALKLAACVGNVFDVPMMSIVSGKCEEEIVVALAQPVQEGLVIPLDEILPLSGGGWVKRSAHAGDESYRFLHDRVQQAADSLLTDEERTDIHVRAGWHLLEKTGSGGRDKVIFDIVNHLNHGVEKITGRKERETIAGLNLEAGKKAKESAAFESAFRYMKAGIGWLGEDGGGASISQLAIDLQVEAAETSYMCGEYAQSDVFAEKALAIGQSALDSTRAYEVMVLSNIARRNMRQALRYALQGLKSLGLDLPEEPNTAHILLAVAKTKLTLVGKSDEDILGLSQMADEEKLAALRLMAKASGAAYFATPNLLVLFSIHMAHFSLRYGLASLSAHGFALFGLVLIAGVGDIDGGSRFGKLALRLEQERDLKECRGKSLFDYFLFIFPWKGSLRDCVTPMLDAYYLNRGTGDVEIASYCSLMGKIEMPFWSGGPLHSILEDSENDLKLLRQMKMGITVRYASLYLQTMDNLNDRPPGDPTELTGRFYSEREESFKKWQASGERSIIAEFSVLKLFLAVCFGEHRKAREYAQTMEQNLTGVMGQHNFALFFYFDSLSRLAMWDEQTPAERGETMKKVKQNQKKMAKWARHAPMNFLHKWHFVEAERARVAGGPAEAEEHFHNAIRLARENQYLQDEAMANERAGDFFLARGFGNAAIGYLLEARACYMRWGAAAKVAHMENRYPALARFLAEKRMEAVRKDGQRTTSETPSSTTSSTSSDEAFNTLDFQTALKATRALSGEIHLPRLLERLLRIVFENAGAQRGILILNGKEGPTIEGEGCIEGTEERITVLQSSPLDSYSALCRPAVNYVMRTGESLVMNDAKDEPEYARDPHVRTAGVRSLLCLPIVHKGSAMGYLYLENALVAGAFTRERLEVLNIIMAQLAVAMENARLYESIEKKVEERTAELQVAMEQADAARERAEEATLLKDKFVTLVSHDLRSPLSSITGMLGLLQDEEFGDSKTTRTKLVQDSLDSMQALLALIDQLLDMSRLRTGRLRPSKRYLDMHPFLEGVFGRIVHAARQKGVHLENAVPRGMRLFADSALFGEVVYNLVANAVKFTPEGGTVTVYSPGEGMLSVRDTGVGIRPDYLENLFRSEVKTTTFGTAGERGTGFGLPYCFEVMQAHGGTLTIETEMGKGSVFHIGFAPFEHILLIVDDQEAHRRMMIEIVRPSIRAEFLEADDGYEALSILKEITPSLIVTDINMPGMDGMEFMEKTREHPSLAEVPIIVATSLDGSLGNAAREKALTLGASAFVRKPVVAQEFLAHIESLLKGGANG